MKFLAKVRVMATCAVLVDTFSKREAARIAKRTASLPTQKLTILPGSEKCDPEKNVIEWTPCPNDTNGDGDCGRPTCAQCHPEKQPLQQVAKEKLTPTEREAWEKSAKDAAMRLVWAEANLLGKTLLPMTNHLDLSDVRREARAEVDRLHSIGTSGGV